MRAVLYKIRTFTKTGSGQTEEKLKKREAFCASPGDCDAIVFTGGIGENDIELREAVLEGLSSLGAEKTHQKKKKKTRAVLCDSIV